MPILIAILIFMFSTKFDFLFPFMLLKVGSAACGGSHKKSAAPLLAGAQGVSDQTPYSADPCQTPKASAGRPSAADPAPKHRSRSPFAALNLNFCRFWPDFSPIKNSSKIRPFKKPPKISKVDPPSAQSSILMSFWHPFALHFLRMPFRETSIF